MLTGRLTVTSPASTDAVLAYLADFRHHPAWRHDVIESELERGAAGESGAVYHQRVKQGPSTGDSRVETTVAAGAIAFRTLDQGPVTVSGTYALAERPEGGTVVDCDTTLDLRGPAKLFRPVMRRAFRKTLARYERALQAELDVIPA